jgi:hypothetical protein
MAPFFRRVLAMRSGNFASLSAEFLHFGNLDCQNAAWTQLI